MFSNVIGHGPILEQLSTLIQEKNPAGTFLFHGPPSVGKKTVALEASKYLLCQEKTDDCSCESCRRLWDEHPDFLFVGKEGKIKVEEVGNFQNFVSKGPFLSDRKIAVFDNLDNITWEASNKLLKTFEDPTDNFSFFLISSNPSSIIPTIRSRCMSYEFSGLKQEDISNVIFKKMGFEMAKARILGWIGSGGHSDIFAQAGTYLSARDYALEFLQMLDNKDIISWLDYVDKIESNTMGIFIDMIVLLFTDMILIKKGIERIINNDMREQLDKVSKRFDEMSFILSTNFLSSVKRYAYLNVDLKMNLKNCLIKIYPFFSRPLPRRKK